MNEPTIMTRILCAVDMFHRTTGRAPDCIYLGRKDWLDLRVALRAVMITEDPYGVTRINGMRIFTVTRDRHLNVAIEGE